MLMTLRILIAVGIILTCLGTIEEPTDLEEQTGVNRDLTADDDEIMCRSRIKFRYFHGKKYNQALGQFFRDVTSVEDCIAICLNRLQNGCMGLYWLDSNAGLIANQCVLINSRNPVEANLQPSPNAVTVFFVPAQFSIDNFRSFANFNFDGNDLLPHVDYVESAEDCAAICLDRLRMGCTGFVWLDSTTDFANRCIPKRRELLETHLTSFSGAVAGLLIQPIVSIQNFRTFVNLDFSGSDLLPSVENVDTAEDCAAICRDRLLQGCTGFTWWDSHSQHPHRCLPMNGTLSEANLCDLSGAVTGFLTRPVSFIEGFHSFFNLDYYGSDLAPIVRGVSTAEDCAQICRNRLELGCTGFTWLDSTTRHPNTCFPKKGVLSETHLSELTSAVTGLLTQPVHQIDNFRSFANKDYYGSDIMHFNRVASAKFCAEICFSRLQEGCTGFTWLDSTTQWPNRCHLKRGKLSETHLSEFVGAVSGLLIQPLTIGSLHVFVNLDFYGNDLPPSVGRVTNLEDCAAICQQRQGCTGFTWLAATSKYPNRCFPKRGELPVAHLSELVGASTVLLKQPVVSINNFSTFVGKEYPDNDLATVDSIDSAKDCAAQCWLRLMDGCTGFTWRDNNSQDPTQCLLKRGTLDETNLSGLVGAVSGLLNVPSLSVSNFRAFFNKDYRGNDLSSVDNVISLESCADACWDRVHQGCTAFTWTASASQNPNRCVLSSGVVDETNLSELAGAVTGFLNHPVYPTEGFRSYYNRDYQGSNLLSNAVSANTPGECGHICAGRQECTGFTWFSSRSPECNLKEGDLVKANLTVSMGAVSGFIDTFGKSSDFHYSLDRFGGAAADLDLLPFKHLSVEDPSGCANICIDRFDQGCTGFNWVPASDSDPATCLFLQGPLLKRDLIPVDGVVAGILQPLCSERGYKVYPGTAIADDNLPVHTLTNSTRSSCTSFFEGENSNGSFYDFIFGSNGVGVCRVYDTTFDLNFLVANDSSVTNVPCEPRHCSSNGVKVYSERSVDTARVNPIFATFPVDEVECRVALQRRRGTFYAFVSLGSRKGTCEVYNTPFEESLLLHERTSSVAELCEPNIAA